MSIFFSHTEKALKADSPSFSILGLFSAIILMILWTSRFFLARITLYEISMRARIEKDKIIADFSSPTAFTRLKPGQTARLYLKDSSLSQYSFSSSCLPATVAKVSRKIEQGHIKAELIIQHGLTTGTTSGLLIGAVEVEVGHYTPAALILQAAGKIIKGKISVRIPIAHSYVRMPRIFLHRITSRIGDSPFELSGRKRRCLKG